ncbi:ABC transporter substrate-binding protein [Paenibacillus hodogayensis]|uniref:ABC transporter substrate-binding protein n=1 Tax=Paenibacillus hodogayensis TaxID=279208 RepID=A0ABV5VRQ5_9BACL
MLKNRKSPFISRAIAPCSAALSLLLLAACGSGVAGGTESRFDPVTAAVPSAGATTAKAEPVYPLTVVADGREVTIPAKPMRIAALSLDAAEAVLELTGPERVSVIAKSAADPALAFQADKAARIRNQVTSATSLDPEQILSYNTDLLVLTKGHDKEKEADAVLRQAGIPMMSLDVWSTFDKMWSNFAALGKAVGEEEKAGAIVDDMKSALARTEKAVAGEPKPSVLVISPVGPGTGPYLIGSTNISSDIVEKAGGASMAVPMGVSRSVKASMEQIVKADPEYIVLLQWKEGDNTDVEAVTQLAGWSALQAVRQDRVKIWPVKRMLYPNRHNAETVEQLAKWLHPGKF